MLRKAYSRFCYLRSDKIKSEGCIRRVTPDDGYEYFFGYYDKSPWNSAGDQMLCMRTKRTWVKADSDDPADIVLVNLSDKTLTCLATTHSWNVQQGCMLQWLGPDFNRHIIYNDFRHGLFCSVILDIETREERVIEQPVYAVANDGSFALTLDFARLHRLRPGYGYCNLGDNKDVEPLPESACVKKINLKEGSVVDILRYRDLVDFEPRRDFADAVHGVNHIMISPNNERFMVLHRWFVDGRIQQAFKKTRLLTCRTDGTDMYNLSDDSMVSHCWWRDDKHILSFAQKKDLVGYFLLSDKSTEYLNYWPEFNNVDRNNNDGHPSYSPDGSRVITDTYPDYQRKARIRLITRPDTQDYSIQTVATVFHPFKYDNDTRCDLHPRWSRSGDRVCFDGVFEGRRALYVVEIDELNK